jgi:hypothetical protein
VTFQQCGFNLINKKRGTVSFMGLNPYAFRSVGPFRTVIFHEKAFGRVFSEHNGLNEFGFEITPKT